MICPTTPKPPKASKMLRKDELTEAAVESPYFSPPKFRKPSGSQLEDEDPFEIRASCNLFPDIPHDIDSNEQTNALASPSIHLYNPLQSSKPSYTNSMLMSKLGKLKPLLIQEQIAGNPWKLLVAVTLLNKTSGRLAIPTFWRILAKWPTPLELSQAHEEELVSTIRHLGTQTVRAKRLIALSKSYIQEPPSTYDLRPSKRADLSSPNKKMSRFFEETQRSIYPATPISHLPGTGPYALDSYRIFCTVHDDPTSEEWKVVRPTDKELIRYLKWKWAFFETMEWSPAKGPLRTVTDKSLTRLIVELEENKLSTYVESQE